MAPETEGVDVYPVGFFSDLKIWRTSRGHRPIRQRARRLLRSVWRLGVVNTVMRPGLSYWNGFLAEPRKNTKDWRRCGHGWTRKRALADLDRHMNVVALENMREWVRVIATIHMRRLTSQWYDGFKVTRNQWATIKDRFPPADVEPLEPWLCGQRGLAMLTDCPVYMVDKQEESTWPWWTP